MKNASNLRNLGLMVSRFLSDKKNYFLKCRTLHGDGKNVKQGTKHNCLLFSIEFLVIRKNVFSVLYYISSHVFITFELRGLWEMRLGLRNRIKRKGELSCTVTLAFLSVKHAFACKPGCAHGEVSAAGSLASENVQHKSAQSITFMGLPSKQSFRLYIEDAQSF